MKITNRADYALHAMLYVSSLESKQVASINEVARAESIPREYLAKILKELVVQGFLKSKRGVSGGYHLARPGKEITFLQVIEAFDGPLDPTNCTKSENKRVGHRKGKCAARDHFERIKKGLVKDLGAINFGDIEYDKYYAASNGGRVRSPKP